jgi:hypothetical protein
LIHWITLFPLEPGKAHGMTQKMDDAGLVLAVGAEIPVQQRVFDLLCMTDLVHASPNGSKDDHFQRNTG